MSSIYESEVDIAVLYLNSRFSQDTGAIVGVSIAAFVTLLSLLFLVFFACRRYRRRRSQNAYVDGLRRLARDITWRSPVDGDEEHFAEKAPSSRQQPISSQGHSLVGLNDGTLLHDQLSHGHGSAESATATMVPMGTVFGGQSYVPAFEHAQGLQCAVGVATVPSEVETLSRSHTATSTEAWHVPAGLYPYPYDHNSRTLSAASLFLRPASSNGHTRSSSSAEEMPCKKRNSSGIVYETRKTSRRHHSTPPSAFLGMPASPFDGNYQRHSQARDQANTSSVKKLFNRLRSGRATSMQSVSSARGTARDLTEESEDSVHPTLPVLSPSLLNPPVRPVLTFPRGITGRGYTPAAVEYLKSGHFDGTAPALWPPATLPEMTPSPVPTDSSGGMIEHLLHPRLALGLARSEQASVASFRDHEDYSRPINGVGVLYLISSTVS